MTEIHCSCCKAQTQRELALIRRDNLMCEAHPGLEFEHDPNCAGPGMPWMIEGRKAIESTADARVAEAVAKTWEKAIDIAMEIDTNAPDWKAQIVAALESTKGEGE